MLPSFSRVLFSFQPRTYNRQNSTNSRSGQGRPPNARFNNNGDRYPQKRRGNFRGRSHNNNNRNSNRWSKNYNQAGSMQKRSFFDRVLKEQGFGDFSTLSQDEQKDQLSTHVNELEEQIHPHLISVLKQNDFNTLFPVQSEVLKHFSKEKDVLVRSHTGTGKTLAFAIPVIDALLKSRTTKPIAGRKPVALVCCPTRELAKQVAKSMVSLSRRKLDVTTIYGRVSYEPQQNSLRRGTDIVVGTPGRIIDLIDRGDLKLDQIEQLILDEADMMLDQGFKEEITRIINETSPNKQTLLFSATFPQWVSEIAYKNLSNPFVLDFVGEKSHSIPQNISHVAMSSPMTTRPNDLADLCTLYKDKKIIVFVNTKRLVDLLANNPRLRSEAIAIHGDHGQYAREQSIARFREGEARILIATDVASRGLDVPDVDIVINYELPKDASTYIHRVGRCGRAGANGAAITLFGNRDHFLIKNLERDVDAQFDTQTLPNQSDIASALGIDADAYNRVESMISDLSTPNHKNYMDLAQHLLDSQGTRFVAQCIESMLASSKVIPTDNDE